MIVATLLLAAYSALILQYRKWFLRLLPFSSPPAPGGLTRFSIIIPARNEEAQIGQCLTTLFAQDYPSGYYEVIVVDDHSTDGTAAVVNGLQLSHPNLKLIHLAHHVQEGELNSYKKKAIEVAIAHMNGDWIVTTDADCHIPPTWLSLLNQYILRHDPVFIAAPVMFHSSRTFLGIFQLLDFMSLQGITAAAVSAGHHSMCNGANLAYRKEAFAEVNGFRGIDRLASGDDMFLMHKIKQQYPHRLGYLFAKGAIVTTAAMPDWKSFFNQRIRWASKADSYQDKGIFRTLALVYALNAGFLLLALSSLLVKDVYLNWLLGLFLAKTLVELSFMIPVSRFYNQSAALYWFPLMQPFHILYTVVAGWLGKFGSYQWKGRNVQ